jgi:3-phenylpropionate/cinnamic acid dioxygenase small subunit
MNTQEQVLEATAREITDWMYMEAELLDAGKYREWLLLVTDDVRYVVPLRVTREREAPTDLVAGMALMDDDHNSLEMRVLRLETEFAWAEDPPSRSRHFVTNIRVKPGVGDDEYLVKSNLLLYRTRGDNPVYDLLSGEREDELRRDGDGFLLRSRSVVLDQSTIQTHNFALIM